MIENLHTGKKDVINIRMTKAMDTSLKLAAKAQCLDKQELIRGILGKYIEENKELIEEQSKKENKVIFICQACENELIVDKSITLKYCINCGAKQY